MIRTFTDCAFAAGPGRNWMGFPRLIAQRLGNRDSFARFCEDWQSISPARLRPKGSTVEPPA